MATFSPPAFGDKVKHAFLVTDKIIEKKKMHFHKKFNLLFR